MAKMVMLKMYILTFVLIIELIRFLKGQRILDVVSLPVSNCPDVGSQKSGPRLKHTNRKTYNQGLSLS